MCGVCGLCTDLQVMASKTKIYIVLEFIDGGELFDKIVRNCSSRFTLNSQFYTYILFYSVLCVGESAIYISPFFNVLFNFLGQAWKIERG